MDNLEKRIASIFGMDEVPEVNDESLITYLKYIKDNIDTTFEITGIEDFEWEEYYLLGPGSKTEYERLRKTRASFRDTYKIIGFDDVPDDDYGIIVNVKRTTDKRKFSLPLADLKVSDKNHPSYRILDDYSVWFVNWR